MNSYLQIFHMKNQLYSQVIPQNSQFKSSKYTQAPTNKAVQL